MATGALRRALAGAALGAGLAGCGDAPVAPEGTRTFVSVVAGAAHACALDATGRAWCWGSNSHGQLGISDGRGSAARPLAVNGSVLFRRLAAGARHTCGLTEDEALWCWGANESGQLGDGTRDRRYEPRPVMGGLRFAHAAAGGAHTCGVEVTGRVWCWGANASGQLGARGAGVDGTTLPAPAAEAIRASSVAAGATHTCAVVTAASAVCWGSNRAGELGAATGGGSPLPVRVAGGHVYRRLSAGASFTCGVTAAEEVVCWGRNREGQLGAARWSDSGTPSSPVAEGGMEAVASAPSGAFSCAAGGVVVCWGSATVDGVPYVLDPHVPAGLPPGDVTSVAAGDAHGCAVVSGAVWCWGEGASGRLGDGREASSTTAVRVFGGA